MTIYRDDELYARGDFDEAHDQRLRDRRNLKHASPIPQCLDETTIRAIRKLPELLALAREAAAMGPGTDERSPRADVWRIAVHLVTVINGGAA